MDSTSNIEITLDHLFRQESGKMVSVLAKIFGPGHLELAEDVTQEALIAALETWKIKGVPDNPRAWLYRTARNKAIDVIRRNKHTLNMDFNDPERVLLNSEYTLASTLDNMWQEDKIQDDFVGMMYACCQEDITEESSLAFILKILCGFSTKETAKAFLTSEDTISKRLYRTKNHFRDRGISPEIPTNDLLPSRTGTVLRAIYLLFNEGYNSTHHANLVRSDLIAQAMMLCKSLIAHPKTRFPEAYALMALMCFHASRVDARLQGNGFTSLERQDRSLWNADLIVEGQKYMNLSAFGEGITPYHLEASIAYEHCIAPNYENTNWANILNCYDLLLRIQPDQVVELNRCLVVLELQGPVDALVAFETMSNIKGLSKYYMFWAIKGAIQERLGNPQEAMEAYSSAQQLTKSTEEQAFLKQKIHDLQSS